MSLVSAVHQQGPSQSAKSTQTDAEAKTSGLHESLVELEREVFQVLSTFEDDDDFVIANVGHAPIRDESAVILSWRKKASVAGASTSADFIGSHVNDYDSDENDGILLYCEIRFKKGPRGPVKEKCDPVLGESSSESGVDLNNDINNNDTSEGSLSPDLRILEKQKLFGQFDGVKRHGEQREADDEDDLVRRNPNPGGAGADAADGPVAEGQESAAGNAEAQSLRESESHKDSKSRHRQADQSPWRTLQSPVQRSGKSGLGVQRESRAKKTVHWRENLEDSAVIHNIRDQILAGRRSRSLDRGVEEPSRRGKVQRALRRTRSLSPHYDGPVGVLVSDDIVREPERKLSRPRQIRHMIRRLRSRVATSRDLWFVGGTTNSFNSRCSDRYDRRELGNSSRHYYFYQTLPKLQP